MTELKPLRVRVGQLEIENTLYKKKTLVEERKARLYAIWCGQSKKLSLHQDDLLFALRCVGIVRIITHQSNEIINTLIFALLGNVMVTVV